MYAQKSKDDIRTPPEDLPRKVHEFLGSALSLRDEHVKICWKAFRETVWAYNSQNHTAISDAKLFYEHGRHEQLSMCPLYAKFTRSLVKWHKQCLEPSIPQFCVVTIHCVHLKTEFFDVPLNLVERWFSTHWRTVQHTTLNFAVHVSVICTRYLGKGCSSFSIIQVCQTTYHNNYLVLKKVRTYYPGMPEAIEVGKHQFISRSVANLFLNLMLISWYLDCITLRKVKVFNKFTGHQHLTVLRYIIQHYPSLRTNPVNGPLSLLYGQNTYGMQSAILLTKPITNYWFFLTD